MGATKADTPPAGRARATRRDSTSRRAVGRKYSTAEIERVKHAALALLPSRVEQWFPDGKWRGREYVVGDLQGTAGDSLSINTQTGAWADFATGEAGGDAVSLYAALRGYGGEHPQLDAARELAAELGLDAGERPGTASAKAAKANKGSSKATPIMPVPADVPAPPDVFNRKEKDGSWTRLEVSQRWEYRDAEGGLLGCVCRFDLADGSKEVIPQTYCEHEDGTRRWRWLSFPKPRPMYGLDRLAAARPDANVVNVEGERAADAGHRLIGSDRLVVMSWPGGGKAIQHVDWSPLAGRKVVLIPDADEAGRNTVEGYIDAGGRKRKGIVQLVESHGADVRVADPPPDVPEGWDLDDAEREGRTPDDVLRGIRERVRQAQPRERAQSDDHATDTETARNNGSSSEGRKQADRLIELAAAASLCHTPNAEGYATVRVSDHRETWAIRRRGFRRWLARRYYEHTLSAPNADAMQQAIQVIEAQAQFDAPEREVHLRRARHSGRLYIDLCDRSWRAIEVDADGWRIVTDPPVLFRRTNGMLPLPDPVAGDIDRLRQHVNVQSEEQFALVVSWVQASLCDSGPYPVLVIVGEPGSAKTTLARRLRDLADPHVAPARTIPRTEQDAWVAAANSGIVVLDNLSSIPAWLSDTLCRLATGGGYSARELYSDADEVTIDVVRPVIVTGITDVASRPDLADRSILLALDPLPAGGRPEAALMESWAADRPAILGGLLDRLVHGLRHRDRVDEANLPRMADYAAWTAACEWPDTAATRAYLENRASAVQTIIEGDPIGGAIARLPLPWSGTSAELLHELDEIVPEAERGRYWPTSGRGMAAKLRQLGPALRSAGIHVEAPRPGDRPRRYHLSGLSEHAAGQPSQSTESTQAASHGASEPDDLFDGLDDRREIDGRPSELEPASHGACDDPDDPDGLSDTHSDREAIDL